MNKEEKIAYEYLIRECSYPPVFEPDGQSTPDFCFNGKVAIEVRRLNRTFFVGGKSIGEEGIYIPFHKALEKQISKFDNQYEGVTYWIAIDYTSPFSLNNKEIWKGINDNLSTFLNSPKDQLPYRFYLGKGEVALSISEAPKSVPGTTFKTIGSGLIDDHSLIQMYIDNIKYCIFEKTRKIDPHKNKYPEWQLLLVDLTNWDLGVVETEKVRASVTELGVFNSVIVIDYQANLLFKVHNTFNRT